MVQKTVRASFSLFGVCGRLGALAWFGDKVGKSHPGILNSPEELIAAVKDETGLIVGGILLLAILYVLMRYLIKK